MARQPIEQGNTGFQTFQRRAILANRPLARVDFSSPNSLRKRHSGLSLFVLVLRHVFNRAGLSLFVQCFSCVRYVGDLAGNRRRLRAAPEPECSPCRARAPFPQAPAPLFPINPQKRRISLFSNAFRPYAPADRAVRRRIFVEIPPAHESALSRAGPVFTTGRRVSWPV